MEKFNDSNEQLIKSLKQEILKDLKKDLLINTQTEFLSSSQVAKMLGINLSTLHNYCKQKKLIKYGLGSRVFFKKEEVVNALIQIN